MGKAKMTPIGNITHSIPSIARKASNTLRNQGRIAVFVGTTGNAVAIAYSEPEYDWQIRRQAQYLVGVYDDDLGENEGFRSQLIRDIRDRVRGFDRRATA